MNTIPELEIIYDQLRLSNQNLLLEKDHRQKIVQFGIPQEVADYLHNLNDKYSLWFADKLNKMSGFQTAQNKSNWIQSRVATDMHGILDWVRNVPNTMLKNYTWEQAVAAQQEYHQNIQIKNVNTEETDEIIKKYDDGFYWVDLKGHCSSKEGASMGHCGRTDAETMYSLRKYTPETNSIESFVTIAANPSDGVWRQAKGKKNSKPKDVYHGYIANILVSKNMLIYQSEYNGQNDFTSNNLKEYVKNNPKEFENPDELIEKIEENTISYDDFKKIYDEFEMNNLKFFSVYLDGDDIGDDDSYIRHTLNFYYSIPLERFGNYALNVKKYIKSYETTWGAEDSKKSRNILNNVFDDFVYSYSVVDIDDKDENIFFRGDIESDDDISSLSEAGLRNFRSFCRSTKQFDKSFDEEIAFNDVLNFLKDTYVLPHEGDDSIKPIKPEDPRQMKFDFANENIFYKIYNNLLMETKDI